MKKLKRLKKAIELVDEYTKEIKAELDKVKREHQKIVLESNSKLISEIAKGENLDEIKLIEKYLKKSKIKQVESTAEDSTESVNELLNHISLDGKDYYYEDKPNGQVFNTKGNNVGEYKCGQIKLTTP